ncbi:pyridoxal-5'-phosphate-dependent protein subunit beta [Caloranaerobacter azorensis H53214]|uniref:Threonine synthase n=1 Tax=Caloranaerobacter azorensis H53214 TaxID=1156417 RepID=A0A096CTE1_9FIRM|nr:threonine synthase [Caloranaerobacter azorensis]KGG79829.1 pyridoxal-5'-phosphate-dependent protein subunit beta [Caloranaerobacter azorensis H53214]
MPVKYICCECGKKYDPTTLAFRCECGGLFNLEEFDFTFSKEDILNNEWSLFRYIKALPFDKDFDLWQYVTMGEGLTPIVPLDNDNTNILVKVDYLMPTLSFKDRGAAVLISKVKELGIKKVIQDSSGNAGNSIAAYAARAGIECDIYVPESTSAKKIKQISSHGATVHIIQGTREDTARAALNAVEKGEGFYASHVYNPYFYQGTKTYAYEIYEQLNGEIPKTIVIPVGNGTLLLGCYYGFKELYDLGLIKEMPKFIAVQSEKCAPIYKAFKEGKNSVDEVTNAGTLAEGIAIAKPMRGKQILEAIRATNGIIITAPENKINEARKYLAQKGFYVEPTTAATFAGFLTYYNENRHHLNGKVIIPLCGAGLKKD